MLDGVLQQDIQDLLQPAAVRAGELRYLCFNQFVAEVQIFGNRLDLVEVKNILQGPAQINIGFVVDDVAAFYLGKIKDAVDYFRQMVTADFNIFNQLLIIGLRSGFPGALIWSIKFRIAFVCSCSARMVLSFSINADSSSCSRVIRLPF